jgi:hypothetical protein
MATHAPRLTAATVESPLPRNWHGGFGERPGETDRLATPILRPGPTQQPDAANTATSAKTSEDLVDVRWFHRRADRSREHQTRIVPLRPCRYALGALALTVTPQSLDTRSRHGHEPRGPIGLHRSKPQHSPGPLQRLPHAKHATIKININPHKPQGLTTTET